MIWVLSLKSDLKGLNLEGAQLFLKARIAKKEAEFIISASSASSVPGSVKFQDCFHLPFNFPWKYPIHLLGSHVSHPLYKTWQIVGGVTQLIRTSLNFVLSFSFPSLPSLCLHCLHSQAISQGHRLLPLKVWSWGYFVWVCGFCFVLFEVE